MKTIFVSSTFKDMHFERDAIRNIALPQINNEARKHNDEFDFCDLRWGINTDEMDTDAGARKVLDVCLDEIDRCRPPMIVILGCRYGWIPNAELIKKASEKKNFIIEDLQRSITALEIEYGALANKDKLRNTLFYFREIEGDLPEDYVSEDEDHRVKIEELKKRIFELTKGNIKTYTVRWNGSSLEGICDFANLVAQDVIEHFKDEWKEKDNMSYIEKEISIHRSFMTEKRKFFKARLEDAQNIIDAFNQQNVTIISGDIGSGKSTLVSYLTNEIESSGWNVIPFVAGLTSSSCDAIDIIKSVVHYLEEKLKVEHFSDSSNKQFDSYEQHTVDEWIDKYSEITHKFASSFGKVTIIIDAADQLNDTDERNELLFIPRGVGDNIRVLISCTNDFKTHGHYRYELKALSKSDKLNVIYSICSLNRRDLTRSVVNDMINKEASNNPLYLSLLVQRLLLMNIDDYSVINDLGGGIKAIEMYQKKMLMEKCPETLEAMSSCLLSEVGKRISNSHVDEIATFLAVARHGLRKKDLAALLPKWSEITFSHFINYLGDCFIIRDDGRYDFAHKCFRNGFLTHCNNTVYINKKILEHLKSLDKNDPIRVAEIVYHTIVDNDHSFFIQYIHQFLDCEYQITAAARVTYDLSVGDGGEWICSLLQNNDSFDTAVTVISFINDYFYKYNRKTHTDINLAIKLYRVASLVAKNHFEQSNSTIMKHAYLIANRRLHTSLTSVDGEDNNEDIIQLELNSIEVAESILNQEYNDENSYQLAVEYAWLATMYCDSYKTIENAYRYFEKAEALLKQIVSHNTQTKYLRELAWLYCDLGSRYYRKKSNHEMGLAFTQKSVSLFSQIHEQNKNAENALDLARGYQALAQAHRLINHNNDFEKAIELVNESISLIEQYYSEAEWIEATYLLSYSYFLLAFFHEILSDTYTELNEENIQAQQYYMKSIRFREALFEGLLSQESGKNLAWSYNRIAIHFRNRVSNVPEAIKAQHKCTEVYRRLYSMYPTGFLVKKIGDSLSRIADDYFSLGESHNYQKSIDYNFEVIDLLSKEINRSNFAYQYENIAKAFLKLGGIENKEKALRYFAKSFEDYNKYKRTKHIANVMICIYDKIKEVCAENNFDFNIDKYFETVIMLKEEMLNYPDY